MRSITIWEITAAIVVAIIIMFGPLWANMVLLIATAVLCLCAFVAYCLRYPSIWQMQRAARRVARGAASESPDQDQKTT